MRKSRLWAAFLTDYPGKTTTYPQNLADKMLNCYTGGRGGEKMKSKLKDRRFWACAVLFAVLFYLLVGVFGDKDQRGPFSITYIVYAYVPIALTVASWLLGIYQFWTGRWKRADLRGWGFLVLVCGSTNVPICIFSVGPWICMGVSLVLGIASFLTSLSHRGD